MAYEKITPIRTEKRENVTLTLTLDTRKVEEQLSVAVRVSCNRNTMYYRTGLKCSRSEWESLSKATKRGELFQKKEEQKIIFDKVDRFTKELLQNNTFTFENLKSKLTGRTENSFSDVWKDIIAKLRSQERVGTADSYECAFRSFSKHVGDNISFDKFGVSLIEEWEGKMKKDNISNTTIGIYMRACRVIANECLKDKFINHEQYPFGKKKDRKVAISRGRSRKEEYIDIPTIKTLASFVAPDSWKKGYSKLVYEAINLWIFSYLSNGMNLADMANLKWDEYYYESGETEFRFIRQKTAETTEEDIEILIPILPEIRNILNEYASPPKLGERVFPQILNGATDATEIKRLTALENSNIRDRLRAACKMLNITKPLSMTFARHSFATNLTIAGVSEKYISQAMGHTSKSITQKYIGLFPANKRRQFNAMLLEG